MGIKSVAVYSEADRDALYVGEADMAVFIGESTPAASYLDQGKLIKVAKDTGADAIHPGYGFLAENVDFARQCRTADVIFIGPNEAAIDAMGSKSKAKDLMRQNGVPVVPGYQGDDQREERLIKEACQIGFPVLLKAAAGGGGKGMRIVEGEGALKRAIQAAKRESQNAFGDDELIIEKYISIGRHIEFQIFGDQQGQVVHLLERECSIQRRYQKIIEESPSPVMTDALRKKMGAAAVKAAQALNYDNAGTVEFIYDDQSGDFYFLEVNTRLQVEHPVTEEITGLDLVELQIASAQGLPLNLKQDEIQGKGYAIEVRLYAEDPANNFLPVTGTIEKFDWPSVDGLRVETAIKSGSAISIYYDPMIAKLIVWDHSRAAAHRKMQYVLRNMTCLGTTTNQQFLLQILEDTLFHKGDYNTHFVEKIAIAQQETSSNKASLYSSIAVALYDWYEREKNRQLLRSMPSGWRSNFYIPQKENYLFGEVEIGIAYRRVGSAFQFFENENSLEVELIAMTANGLRMAVNGVQYSMTIVRREAVFFVHNEAFGNIRLVKKNRFPVKQAEKTKGGYETPMPSSIIKVLVGKGQTVKSGEGLVVLSSMKMESTIYADGDGVVEEVFVEEGEHVEAGFLLLKIKG